MLFLRKCPVLQVGQFFRQFSDTRKHPFGLASGCHHLLIGLLQAVFYLHQMLPARQDLAFKPRHFRSQVLMYFTPRTDGIGVDHQHQQHHGAKAAEHDVKEGKVERGKFATPGCRHGVNQSPGWMRSREIRLWSQ
jgi:hypothetical protein